MSKTSGFAGVIDPKSNLNNKEEEKILETKVFLNVYQTYRFGEDIMTHHRGKKNLENFKVKKVNLKSLLKTCSVGTQNYSEFCKY